MLKRIRAKEGLAYSVYSYPVPGSIFRGYFLASLETKIATTSRAINMMLEVMREMREKPVTEQELAEAKSFYEGSLARRMETYPDVARLIINQEFYGLKDNYYIKDIEEIKKLTREDILHVARKYIDLNNYNIAIVTKVADLKLEIVGIDESMIEKKGI
jgi:zinc protease